MATAPAVRLAGLPSRQAPMTWGQKNQYIAIEMSGEESYRQNLVRSVPVPPGVETALICEALAGILSRHEALRTHFGRCEEDGFWQRVSGSVDLPLLMFDAADDAELATAKAHVAGHNFDHETQLPVRFAVVSHPDGTRSVELAVSHLAADAAGADVLAGEVGRALAGEALLPAPQKQPVDRAAWEGSPEGQAMAARNVDRWRTLMQAGATKVPAARGDGLRPRFWKGGLASPALRIVLPALATRLRISPTALVLAGMAHVVAARFGLDSVAIRIGFNNRVARPDKVAIESLMGWGLCHLTEVDGDRTQLAKAAANQAFQAYTTARFDIYDVLEVADRLRSEGAGETLPQFFLNIIDLPAPAADLRLHHDHLRELQAAATFDAAPSHTRDSSGLFILQVTQVPEAVRLGFLLDTRLLSKAELEQTLRQVEDWLVSLALKR